MTQNTPAPSAHSSLVGGSTAARRLHCPRSIHLEKLVPPEAEDDSSPYAREGTALHELMAEILGKGVDDPTTLLPFTFAQKGADGAVLWSFTVDRDLWDQKGAPALAAFDAFVASVEAGWNQPFDFLIEQRVAFPGLPDAFGTSDIVGRCGDEVFVIDWKFGSRPVSAQDNAQIMFYTAGALNTCAAFLNKDLTIDAKDPGRPVTGVIIQPMAGDEPSVWETDLGAINGMAAELRDAVYEGVSKGNDAPIAKGKGCDWCRCKPICPLYNRDLSQMADKLSALKAAQDKQAAEPAPINDHRAELAAILSDLLDLSEAVEDWAASTAKLAHDLAMDGVTIPGRKLTAKTGGARSWAVEEGEVAAWFKNRRYKLDEYMPRKLLSMPQAEKLLKADGRTLPADMIKTPGITGYKLVRDGHPGPAYAPGAETSAAISGLAERLAGLAERVQE